MAKTIKNDNHDDLFGRGTEIKEYVPCVKPAFAEITQDFIVDRLMYVHDAALSDEKPNYTAALKAVEIVAKMKGMLDKKEEKQQASDIKIIMTRTEDMNKS